jgi:hypothetical protein
MGIVEGEDNVTLVFVADDLGAWLIGLLTERGRTQLASVLLGTEQERALRLAATATVRQTATDLRPYDDAHAEQMALVISEVLLRNSAQTLNRSCVILAPGMAPSFVRSVRFSSLTREVFTFRADLVRQGLAGGLPTG